MRAHRNTIAIAVLLSCAGSCLAQTEWNNASGGVWSDPANWLPMDVPDTITESALLGNLGSPYTVELNLSPTLLGLGVTADATLNISSNRLLSIATDGVLNAGLIVVDDAGSGFNTIFQSATDCSILGSGFIDLNALASDLNDSIIRGQTGATLTIGAAQTITGSGSAIGPMVLNGTIDANRLDRDLLAGGAIDMTGGGTMMGTNGGKVLLTGQITGGTLAGGIETTGTTATLSGPTNTGANALRPNSILTILAGGLTNNGSWLVDTTGSGFNTFMQAGEPTIIDGTGTIELNALAVDMSDSVLRGQTGATLTIGANQTVTGSGLVDGPIVLDGTVNADRDARDILATNSIDMSGGGTMMGTNNGKIRLSAQVTGGTLAGGVEASGSSTTISGSTSTGANGLRGNSFVTILSGGMTNNGSWLVDTTGSGFDTFMQAGEPATISGTGTIELNALSTDMNDAVLRGQTGATLTIGTNQTVTGSGLVDGPIALDGTINADRDGRDLLVIDSIDMSGGGTMIGTNNGKVRLSAQVTGGTLAGGVEASGSSTTISGSTSAGANGLRGNSFVTILSGGMTNNGSWFINTDGSGANTFMQAGEPAVINGTGTIELNALAVDFNDAVLRGQDTATLTIGAGQTVTGSGLIDGPIVLNGTFNADRDGRDLLVIDSIDMSGGGTMIGTNNGKVRLNAQVTGGTFAGGVEASDSSTTISGSTSTGDNGLRGGAVVTILSGGMTNNGSWLVNTTGSGANVVMQAGEPAIISGTGTIELNAVASDMNDAVLRGQTDAALTIGSGQTVTGSGLISGPVVLDGTFNADRNARDLAVTADVDMTGGGIMMGTNGGKVALSGSATNGQWAGGTEVTGGATNVSGVFITNENGTRGGGVIILDAIGITIDGNLLVNTNSSGANSGVTTSVSTTINGAGSIELNVAAGASDFWDAYIQTTDAATLTFGPDLSVIGRGRLSGDFVLQGTLAPGDATDATNQIDISGLSSLESTSTVEIGIAGTSTADFDRVTGNSTMTLDGTLELSLLDGFTPIFEQRFTVIDVGVLDGEFSAVVSPTAGLGVFRIVQSADKIEAVWTCQADLNGDGVLDFFDVQFFLNAFTSEALYSDYNEDGAIDFFDVLAFLNDFSLGCL
jgi:fibronectin-binding autotransporter adhesin